MISEIDKLKHFHIEDWDGTNFAEAIYKYRTSTGKMTASDYTHLFGYLNPYYRSAYNVSKRRK